MSDNMPLEELREVSLQMEMFQKALEDLNSEERAHPQRPTTETNYEAGLVWAEIKAGFAKRKDPLRQELARLKERRVQLRNHWTQMPVSKTTLEKFITELTAIEARFSVKGWEAAWDSLSNYIDVLEHDFNRVAVEEQVAQKELVG